VRNKNKRSTKQNQRDGKQVNIDIDIMLYAGTFGKYLDILMIH